MTMAATEFIDGLSEIAQTYDALLCDAWGVIHNGKTLLPGAAEAMQRFRQTRGPVVILTNAPKPSSVIPEQLDRLGLPRDAWDAIVTSGDSTRAEIERFLPAPAYRIGPPFDDPLFEGMTIDFVPFEDAAFIVCTGLNDGFTETPDQYESLLRDAAARNLPMVCANPDIQVNWGGRLMWCAGAIAEIYESYGGAIAYGGKPFAPIYNLARTAIDAARAKDASPPRLLAVGDGLMTDVLGANRAGIDALLVVGAGGLHEGADDRKSVIDKLSRAGLRVAAITEGLKW